MAVTESTKAEEEQTPQRRYGIPAGAPFGICGACHQPVWVGFLGGGLLYCVTHEEVANTTTRDRYGSRVAAESVGSAEAALQVPLSPYKRLTIATMAFANRFSAAIFYRQPDAAEYWGACLSNLWSQYQSTAYLNNWRQLIREVRTPEMDYKAHILQYAEAERERRKWSGPSEIGEAFKPLQQDSRFNRHDYNGAMLELEAEGKVVYWRKGWWLPEEKRKRAESDRLTRQRTRSDSSPLRRAGLA